MEPFNEEGARLEIKVKKAAAWLVGDESLMQGSDRLYLVEFTFDESWEGFDKTAVFEAGGVKQPPVPLVDDRCIIPSACLAEGGAVLRVGVYGDKGAEHRDTVWCATSKVLRRVDAAQLTPPVTPWGDVTAQVLAIIRAQTATDEEALTAINEGFQSDWTPPPEEETPENTATNEEVEDALDEIFGA